MRKKNWVHVADFLLSDGNSAVRKGKLWEISIE